MSPPSVGERFFFSQAGFLCKRGLDMGPISCRPLALGGAFLGGSVSLLWVEEGFFPPKIALRKSGVGSILPIKAFCGNLAPNGYYCGL